MSRRTRRSAQHVLFALAHPFYWPRWLRRMALLCAPVMAPLWIALLCASVALVIAEDLFETLAGFWYGNPHARGRRGYRGTTIKLVPSPDPVDPLLLRSRNVEPARQWPQEEAAGSGEHRVMFLAPRQRAAGE